MNDEPVLPPSVAGHLNTLKQQLGDGPGQELEAALTELLKQATEAGQSHPVQSSALFMSRPSGYVD